MTSYKEIELLLKNIKFSVKTQKMLLVLKICLHGFFSSNLSFKFLFVMFSFLILCLHKVKRTINLVIIYTIVRFLDNTKISKQISNLFFLYQKTLIRTFHTSFRLQNNLCEFTTREHKFKRWFCNKKSVWNVRF